MSDDNDADWVFVFDEPCYCLHTIWDLDTGKTILHTVKEEGRINNLDLIQYRRPTYMKANKKSQGGSYSDACLRLVKALFN